MSKNSVAGIIILGAALAACSDTSRTMTAPDERPALTQAPADAGFGVTADGPFDVSFGIDDASARQASAQGAAVQRSLAGSRASGHVGLTFAPPFLGLVSERYSFVAQGTGPAPTVAADGEFELMLTTVTGVEQKFHGDVICMATVGNTTRIAGRLEKVWINNVQRPITGATHTIWTVQDNGEGQGTTDTASPMFFNNATNAQLHCTAGFTPPQFLNPNGNIQVRP